MNNDISLIGSLSNDLLRVASLSQRGSMVAAIRFRQEAKRWANQLLSADLPDYLKKIIQNVTTSDEELNDSLAEYYLMSSILLQNYALHHRDKLAS